MKGRFISIISHLPVIEIGIFFDLEYFKEYFREYLIKGQLAMSPPTKSNLALLWQRTSNSQKTVKIGLSCQLKKTLSFSEFARYIFQIILEISCCVPRAFYFSCHRQKQNLLNFSINLQKNFLKRNFLGFSFQADYLKYLLVLSSTSQF